MLSSSRKKAKPTTRTRATPWTASSLRRSSAEYEHQQAKARQKPTTTAPKQLRRQAHPKRHRFPPTRRIRVRYSPRSSGMLSWITCHSQWSPIPRSSATHGSPPHAHIMAGESQQKRAAWGHPRPSTSHGWLWSAPILTSSAIDAWGSRMARDVGLISRCRSR